MQCITYDIERVDNASFSAEHIGKRATLSVLLAQGANFTAKPTELAELSAMLIGCASFTAERVCSFFPGAALAVTPDYVWLNEGNDYTAHFEVVSNVEWNIE